MIEKSFQPYYEVTGLGEVTDPNIIYDLQYELNALQVYTNNEVTHVNELEFSGKTNDQPSQERLNFLLDPAVDRVHSDLTEDQQEDFKRAATKYLRTYQFI